MAVYEMRTYNVQVGKMPEAIGHYQKLGWPALEKHSKGKLVGYFVSDTGPLHQLVHLWKFEDDADRRSFWKQLFADEAFQEFARNFRPLVLNQNVQLLLAAPWGPHP